MTIEIYQNCRSVKPFARWQSKADMINFLEENGNIKRICDHIKATGDKTQKQNLPAMMPMGTVGDKTRKKDNC